MHKQQNHPALASSISSFTPANTVLLVGGRYINTPSIQGRPPYHTTAGALERPQNFEYIYQHACAYMHSLCMLFKLSLICHMPYGFHKPDSWSCRTFQQPFCESSCACKDYMIFEVMWQANPVHSELQFDLHDGLRDQKCCLRDLRVLCGTSAANHLNACL